MSKLSDLSSSVEAIRASIDKEAILKQLTPKKVLAVVGGACTAYFVYKTVSIYFYHRKYRHIPGPPRRKYNRKLYMFHKIILFKYFFSQFTRVLFG